MNYPIQCPECEVVVDSHDSLAESKADLAFHLEFRHGVVEDGND